MIITLFHYIACRTDNTGIKYEKLNFSEPRNLPTYLPETNPSTLMASLHRTLSFLQKYVRGYIQKKSFPFMQLPPELRNSIYEFAIGVRTEPVTLVRQRHTIKRCRQPRGALALSQVCKQVRLELRRLYMRDARIAVELYDMAFFLTTWFPDHKPIMEIPAPINILLWITAEDVSANRTVEMRHFFLTLVRNPAPVWWCERQYFKWHSELYRDPLIYRKINRLGRLLESADLVSDELLQDIQSGFISNINFTTNRDGTFNWLLTVTKEGATRGDSLTELECKKLEQYCQHLGHRPDTYISLQVKDETGKQVQLFRGWSD